MLDHGLSSGRNQFTNFHTKQRNASSKRRAAFESWQINNNMSRGKVLTTFWRRLSVTLKCIMETECFFLHRDKAQLDAQIEIDEGRKSRSRPSDIIAMVVGWI